MGYSGHVAADLSELCAFVAAHPTGAVAPSDVRWFLARLVSGPASIFDLSKDGRRSCVAVLADRSQNASDAAELVVLGRVAGTDVAPALAWGVEAAERCERRCVEVVGPEVGPFEAPLLARHGFSEAFGMYMMRRDGGPSGALPASASFVDLDVRNATLVHGLVQRAFADVPGSFVAPPEAWVERALAQLPPTRVLFRDGRPVAFVRVGVDAHGEGHVHSLGRDPQRRGEGLGPLLMLEALRLLAGLSATTLRLEVAAQNRQALALYERFGFTVASSVSVWRRALVRPAAK